MLISKYWKITNRNNTTIKYWELYNKNWRINSSKVAKDMVQLDLIEFINKNVL